MKIITASAYGMCFGVRDALDALSAIDHPRSVAIYGELVHNDVVLVQLETRGFQQMSETQRGTLPAEPNVVITAHGISNRRRHELLAAGKSLIDTTCPLVARVHRAAQEWASSGAFVVVIGRADHVEVEGITGDLTSFAVVPTIESVEVYSANRIAIISQTTFSSEAAEEIRRQIERLNPQATIHWIDTICQPTKDRQQSLADLIANVQAVVVVGGRHSHNTRWLVERCRQKGLTAFHVQDAEELDPHWFDGIDVVGLTAGTSTLPGTIEKVHDRLKAIGCSTEFQRMIPVAASGLLPVSEPQIATFGRTERGDMPEQT